MGASASRIDPMSVTSVDLILLHFLFALQSQGEQSSLSWLPEKTLNTYFYHELPELVNYKLDIEGLRPLKDKYVLLHGAEMSPEPGNLSSTSRPETWGQKMARIESLIS